MRTSRVVDEVAAPHGTSHISLVHRPELLLPATGAYADVNGLHMLSGPSAAR
ncbi:hypothetical protein ACQP2U_09070 [Nocardia sp. CA-084685]|uniref:hypothetical protein n=1 Tax=Nocardia sp. CA-084685 TaxID=3239970 RepID=UPI003D98DF75